MTARQASDRLAVLIDPAKSQHRRGELAVHRRVLRRQVEDQVIDHRPRAGPVELVEQLCLSAAVDEGTVQLVDVDDPHVLRAARPVTGDEGNVVAQRPHRSAEAE